MRRQHPTHKATASREKLLAAARTVFARHGYEGSTIRMICQEADASVGVINYHWGSKEKLWQAVCEDSVQQLAGLLAASADFSLPPHQFVPHITDAIFEALLQHQDLMRIVVWATLEAGVMDYDQVRGALNPLIAYGATYWKQQQEAGELAVEDLDLALMHMRAILLFTFVDAPGHQSAFGTDLSDPRHAARVKKALTHSVRALLGIQETNPSKTSTQRRSDYVA